MSSARCEICRELATLVVYQAEALRRHEITITQLTQQLLQKEATIAQHVQKLLQKERDLADVIAIARSLQQSHDDLCKKVAAMTALVESRLPPESAAAPNFAMQRYLADDN